MTKRFAVVCEAEADFRTATELADRVLVEAIDWLDPDQLLYQRSWEGADAAGQLLTWKAIKRLAREAGIKPHQGHFQGEPGLPDAAAARRAIDYLLNEFLQLDAILLVRDQDDEPERRGGLEQARGVNHSGIVIVVGLAVVERECWLISGFEPLDDSESSRLQDERRTLGFDPRERSHDLTACKNDNALRSPKRVLRELSGDDRERERRCWMETLLEVLRERGSENGLAAYLREVRDRLAPMIGHVSEG
jgi:hypothetical protein